MSPGPMAAALSVCWSDAMKLAGCPLCESVGGVLILEAPQYRVIRAEEPDFPAFYRVVWTAHVAEWSDLQPKERVNCMEAVAAIERVLREQLAPTKINLAALGNMVPHLHWHVVARFDWDTHFPAPVWAAPARTADPARLANIRHALPGLDAQVRKALQVLASSRSM